MGGLADGIASSAIIGGTAATAISGISLAFALLAGLGAIVAVASIGYMAYTCMESEKVENQLKKLSTTHN